MKKATISQQHQHTFHESNPLAQRKILIATVVTAVMMVIEIIAGTVFQSMALLADGWHMSSHVIALGLAYLSYRAATHYAKDPRFNFGSWKIEILAAYTSAILLMGVAILMAIGSINRLFHPVSIEYNEAIFVATLGLLINLVCAWLLKDHHDHTHEHHGHLHHAHHAEDHHHVHEDLNQKAAFLHVVADATTSVLAIIALILGKYFGWDILDAILGLVGSVLVAQWSWGLLKQTGVILLDAEMQHPIVERVLHTLSHSTLLADAVLTDVHLSQVSKNKFSCMLQIESANQLVTAKEIRHLLSIHHELVHTTIEINPPAPA
ncbi:CDF family Co(II)/Ni(II) efflux transporter DmeF [Acinetobacter apis]|uniref:Cation diffusion facilitator family transporter n=1 Tax=Acinetobacter apis TaxID=1229165 RepID=A0A217EGQ3_9GAMM|nr:CDF family Co(II)/Ni(II) efflux transporter DmeF [Acinetobacter apis]SNQ29658.1 cation diffusion facilitator family transporter [Acinetobacter apis]